MAKPKPKKQKTTTQRKRIHAKTKTSLKRSRKTKTKKKLVKKLRKAIRRGSKKPKISKRKSYSRRKTKKIRATGASIQKEVFSRKLNKKVIVIKKFTNFTPMDIYTPIDQIVSVMRPYCKKHFEKIKPSYRNLWLFSLRYSFDIDGNNRTQFFSLSISKLSKFEQFMHIVEQTVELFITMAIEEYSKQFLDIYIDGLKVQGYKKPQ